MESEYGYRFTEKAEGDLEEILAYISKELCNLQAARELGRKIFEQIDNACKFPDSGLVVENEFLRDKTVRRLLADNYSIYYKAVSEERTVYIIRIIYSRRNLDEILKTL